MLSLTLTVATVHVTQALDSFPFYFVFQLVQDLLKSLPTLFQKTMETQSALGSALQAAFKLLSPTGGRMTIFQTQLPNLGVGALQSREDPNQRASAKVRETQMESDWLKRRIFYSSIVVVW